MGDKSPKNKEKRKKKQAEKKDNRLPIDAEKRKQNRTLPTPKVLNLLHTQLPAAYRLAEVVGKWVWVRFTEQPAAEVRQQYPIIKDERITRYLTMLGDRLVAAARHRGINLDEAFKKLQAQLAGIFGGGMLGLFLLGRLVPRAGGGAGCAAGQLDVKIVNASSVLTDGRFSFMVP